METPSSTRRITRSQAMNAANTNTTIPMSRKIEDSEKGVSKLRPITGNQQDRSALIDITNDSPIVGLAMGSLVETPSSKVPKKRNNNNQAKEDSSKTPGSGEALLRGQVKTLLQKVEEEAELSKLPSELNRRTFSHLKACFIKSPTGLLAPTPANTPLVLMNPSDDVSFKNSCLALVSPSPVQEQLMASQMVTELLDGTKEEGSPESEKSFITRSLLLDFSEKSEGSDSSGCSSVVTNIGGESSEGKEKSSMEEDEASVWSLQVNASSRDEEEEDDDEDSIEEIKENEDDDYIAAEEEEKDGGMVVDELCEGMSRISVYGEKMVPQFTGKHTRFVYNSDDELEGEEDCGSGESEEASPGVVRLKGLPTPRGKHFRFPEEMEEEEEDN